MADLEFEELSRPHALFIAAASAVPEATSYTPEAWSAALGCTLEQFIATGFFAFVGTSQQDGWFDPAWLAQPNFDLLEGHLGLTDPEVLGLLDRHFAVTPDRFREMDRNPQEFAGVEEHWFNPLTARPMIKMRNGKYLAPHPLLILHRLSCNGLYYDRVTEPGFTDQLGPVFEHYVGMHLDLLAGAAVHHSIRRANGNEVIDYVVVLPDVVLPDVVLLIEVKATRLTEAARAGFDKFDDDAARTIGKAQTQINTANQMIDDGDAAFSFVPTDLPRRGLIVTLEPYWGAHTGFGAQLTQAVPTTVAHIREMEFLASVTEPVGTGLLTLDGQLEQRRTPIRRKPWGRQEPDPRPGLEGHAPREHR
jgi:hypothetical protein